MNSSRTNAFLFLFVCLAFTCTEGLRAQDVHYSQTGNTALQLSPGLTGVFPANHRFATSLRRQWASSPVPYLQMAASYDMRFTDKNDRFKPWAAGLVFNYDRAGDLHLSLAQLGLSGSYSFKLAPGKRHFLTLGAMLGGAQRAFRPNGLAFDDQYTLKEGYTSTNATAERFGNTSRFLADLSLGMNLHFRADSSRAVLDVGAGFFHINEPEKSFFNEKTTDLQTRYSLYALASLPVAPRFDVLLSAAGQIQQPAVEGVLGAGGAYHFSTKKTQELSLLVHVYYRIGDAIIPSAGINYRDWQVQVSYDANTSPLREATAGRGGPELTVIYLLKQVQKAAFCKNCPTYM